MAGHQCDLEHCDGTRLGHDLAAEFPAETARVVEQLARLAEPVDGLRVNPANLQADPPSQNSGTSPRSSAE